MAVTANLVPMLFQHIKHPHLHILVEAEGACEGCLLDFRHLNSELWVILQIKDLSNFFDQPKRHKAFPTRQCIAGFQGLEKITEQRGPQNGIGYEWAPVPFCVL